MTARVAIVDYGVGNLHSAQKAFEPMPCRPAPPRWWPPSVLDPQSGATSQLFVGRSNK